MKVVDYLLTTLETNGVEVIFGNPGTTEIPIVRACEQHSKLEYIVALSEVAAVPMADGYARAGRRLGVVNLHVAPGLGNGMGALYTAGIAGTPLLVLVGGQDRRFLHTQPILWGPLEAMARTVCKDVYTLGTRFDAAANVRRAVRKALTLPYAPVALVCPPDLLETEIDDTPLEVTPPALGGANAESVDALARFVTSAEHPVIVAAEDVHWSGAAPALEALAEALRAPVYAAPYTGVLPISSRSRWYAGYLPPSLKQISERLRDSDAVLFVGGRGLRTTLFSEPALPRRKAWIGADLTVQPADAEFELACVADIAETLRDVNARVSELRSAGRPDAAPSSARVSIDLPAVCDGALHPTRAIAALLERFAGSLWFDESGLSTSDVRQWMRLPAGDYIINGSGGIGWGLAASIGGAISRRDRHVIAVIGDGSALYASEALWTGAHHGSRVLLVVLANRRYATLHEAAERLADGALSSFTLEPPVLDFSGLATLYGWRYAAASNEGELEGVLRDDTLGTANTVLELKLDPTLKPVTAARHF